MKDLVYRPAANERSPNRKPRHRQHTFQEILSYEKAHSKKLWLRIFRATGNFKQSCEVVRRRPSTVGKWMIDDPDFRAERDKIKEVWRDLLNSGFTALGEEALKVVQEILESSLADKDLRFKVAQWVLKSQGVGQDKPKTLEHTGPGGGPIPISGIVVHTTGQVALPTVVEEEYGEEEQ